MLIAAGIAVINNLIEYKFITFMSTAKVIRTLERVGRSLLQLKGKDGFRSMIVNSWISS